MLSMCTIQLNSVNKQSTEATEQQKGEVKL
jgi:hypothetical protein